MKQVAPIAGIAMLSLAACASPKVHPEVDGMDHRLSCSQMEHEIREMNKHRMKVEESKGFTLRNVVTTAVFFPITMATYSNVNDAQEASMHRQKHLMDLYTMKGCNAEGYQAATVIRERMVPVSHRYSMVVDREAVSEEKPARRYSDAHIHSASYLFQ